MLDPESEILIRLRLIQALLAALLGTVVAVLVAVILS